MFRPTGKVDESSLGGALRNTGRKTSSRASRECVEVVISVGITGRNACGRAAATSTAGRVPIGWWRGRLMGPSTLSRRVLEVLRSSRISSARTWARCSSSPDRPRTQQTDSKRVSCLPEDCGESQEDYRGRGVGVSRVRQWCGCTDTDTRSCATPRTSCTAVGAFAPSGGRAHAGPVGQLHTDRVTEGRQEPP